MISRHIRVKWHFRTVKWLHPRLDPLPLPEYLYADSSAEQAVKLIDQAPADCHWLRDAHQRRTEA